MSCTKCKFANIKISHPNDLKSAIRQASDGVDSGKLIYLGIGSYGTSFKYLSTRYDWNDFVHNYFKCSECSQLIKLWAETYHGSGGGLMPVDSEEGEITPEEL